MGILRVSTSRHLALLTLCVLSLLASGTACTRSSTPGAPQLKTGAPMASFQGEQVLEITLAKNDPRVQDVWTARLTRANAKDEWRVASAPGGQTLLDTRADSTFINHLLSLLKTLSVQEEAPRGPLSSFGLEPPLFSVRWGDPANAMNEIRLGDPSPGGPGNYAIAVNAQGPSSVVVVRGAALQMLGMIEKFDVLRRRKLVTFEADDVDEFELWRGRAKQLYAQRAGDDWTDVRHRKLSPAVGSRLQQLTHLRVQAFLDDPARAARLRERLERRPDYRAIFKDRAGNPTELQLGIDSGRTWARITSRAEAVFEVHPDAVKPWLGRN